MSIEIQAPEIPQEGPWSDGQIRLALVTRHPVRIKMFAEDRYWAFARERARQEMATEFSRQESSGSNFLSSVFRRIGIR
jgi:hypothetical protein